jgi:dipeptidyl-peptidase-3
MKELEGFKEAHPLNSRVVKEKGRIVEEVYRVGGRYGSQIAAIVQHLEAAIPFATEPMAKALAALVKFYKTGETADREAYDIAWVQDKASPVDTINGFIEVYLDARGIKGGWEGLVFYVNREKTTEIQKLAQNAQWFEDHMLWDPKYRKQGVQGITANAIDVVIETGDSGPVTPVGINLPNDQAIRERYGSKSVSLSNVNGRRQIDVAGIPGSFRGRLKWRARKMERGCRRPYDEHARVIGRVRESRRAVERKSASRDQGALLRARRSAPIWWPVLSADLEARGARVDREE